MKLHQYTKKTIAMSLAVVMAAGLAGCRASDEIQKIVYTQEATEVDDTEVTRRWEQEAEEQDDYSDELQEEEDNEENDDEEEMEADQISADETVEETVPEEADETETPTTEEVAQVASAEETGMNQIANDSDEETGSSQVSGSADGGSDVTDSNPEDMQDEDDDTESPASGQASGSSSDSTHASGEEEPDGEEPDEEEPDEEEPDEEEPDEEEPDEEEPDESGDSESEGTQQDEEGSTSEEGDNSAGEDTEEPRKQIYDTDGNLIALPDSVSTIVAAGEAALITQMLGGEGVLLGSSSEFLGNTLVQSVFADEGISSVSTLWSGDGSSPMSDESFEELLELNPDCVLEISGETNFSSSQETALKEAQIYIVTLPALTTSTNICVAVETVGQLLDDHAVGNTTSLALAEEYVTYEENLVTEVQSRKGTYHKLSSGSAWGDYFSNISSTISNGDFAMILWDWDDSFSFTYSYNGTDYISQSGGAVTNSKIEGNPATYYLAVAGVMNTSSTGSGETLFVPFYSLGASNDLTDEDQNQDRVTTGAGIGSLGSFNDGSLGMSGSSYSATYGTSYTYSSSNYEVTGYSMWAALGYTSKSGSGGYVSGAYAWLGTARFPYVIAASQEIQERMNASKTSATGLYAIRTWGIEIDDTIASIAQARMIFYNNTKPGQSSLVVNGYTTSRQDYDIVVNPSGCGDWLSGSVESVLESVWISNLYWGNETYSDLDMEEEISEFYETFYRHSLSSGELNDILDGE